MAALLLLAAALVAAAAMTSTAFASPAATDGARGEPRARAAQSSLPTMPVVEDPDYVTSGAPTPDAAPAAVGLDDPPVDPGTTTGRTGVAPVRVTCRRNRRARRIACVARSDGRVVSRCTYRGRRVRAAHSRSCRARALRRLAASPRAKAAAIAWQGWPSSVSVPVGMLTYNGRPLCSATVVDPTLVLTAAHCIWNEGGYLDYRAIRFIPGRSWGDFSDPSSVDERFGQWGLSNMWVPESYKTGDFSADFALLEIPPLSDGRRINAFTGAFSITPNVLWSDGMRSYQMGYPQSGFWSTADGGYGRGQYACDSRWSNRYMRDGAGWSVATDCSMNQGASGGPWFVVSGNGWTVAGVNSRCTAYEGSPPRFCNPWAREMITSYFDDGFLVFWNSVQPQLRFR